MAEALISSLIQKLESRGAEMPEYVKEETGGVIDELITLLDLVRNKRFGEGSSQYCSILKVVEIAQDSLVSNEIKGVFVLLKEIKSVKSLLRQTKMRVLESREGSGRPSNLIHIPPPPPLPPKRMGREGSCRLVQEFSDLIPVAPPPPPKQEKSVRPPEQQYIREGEVSVSIPTAPPPLTPEYDIVETLIFRETERKYKMVETLILRGAEQLESLLVQFPDTYESYSKSIGSTSHELMAIANMLPHFLSDKKLEEGSKISYFMCDLREMALDLLDLTERTYGFPFRYEIYSIEGRLKNARKSMLRFRVDEAEAERSEIVGEGDRVDAVGLEEEVELLLSEAICNKKQGLRTTLITGMIGVGKTTLARQIYNHVDVVGRFELRVWVRVSKELTQKEILMKLIQQVVDSKRLRRDSLTEKMLERADNPTLQQMLHEHLQGVSYLIVMDDLPGELYLNSVRRALPEGGANGSRLLLTSPSQRIHTTIDYTHAMKTLNPDKSWQLFTRTVGYELETDHEFPKKLKKKGREMLTGCDGLPLSIIQVGKQLAEKRRLGNKWEQLLESSIDLGPTLDLMDLSYQKMDPLVKACFLHLALIKKSTTMRTEKLECFWAAAGIVSGQDHMVESYLSWFIRESIIELKDNATNEGRKRYRVNAILHQLSIKKAEEDIGFVILRNNESNRTTPLGGVRRHCVISCSREKFNYSADLYKHLDSLVFHGGGYFDASPSFWESFEHLKILDMEDFGLKIVPETIGTLVELRYLGLRNNHIKNLPTSLGRLKELEVLDIAQNFIVQVPDIIWEMSSLKLLYMSEIICRNPLKIDGLKNLKTLKYISVDNWVHEASGLQMMTSLSNVGIQDLDGNSDISKLLKSLSKLKLLRTLTLRGLRFKIMPCLDDLHVLHDLNTLRVDGRLTRLPAGVDSFPPRLYILKLVNTCLDEDPMPVLEQLPYLIRLKLQNAYTGRQMVVSEDGLSSLQSLCLEELWNLRDVRVGKGAMRKVGC